MAIQYSVITTVKMPDPSTRPTGSRYPFNSMEVGNSFYVPEEDVASRESLRQSCYAAGRRLKMKFKLFDEDSTVGDAPGYRVFRVE